MVVADGQIQNGSLLMATVHCASCPIGQPHKAKHFLSCELGQAPVNILEKKLIQDSRKREECKLVLGQLENTFLIEHY